MTRREEPAVEVGTRAEAPLGPVAGGPLVSIVVPVRDQLAYTRICIESLMRFTTYPYELIVVDNGSADGTAAYLSSVGGVRVVTNAANRGFPAACNQGMRLARGQHILLLNNDTVLTPGWLEGLLCWAERSPEIGMVGPCTNCASGPQVIQPVAYRTVDELAAHAARFRRERLGRGSEIARLVGFCLLIKRQVVERVGLLDERFGIGNFEDDDYCLRVRMAGFRLAMAGDVFIHHFGSRTFAASGNDYGALLAENRQKFCEKWNAPAGGGPATASAAAAGTAW